jgi:hypothetical protein
MSVHFDASRGQYAVRRREQGRNRIRRFGSEAEAVTFERTLASPAAGQLGSLEARLTELEARLAAAQPGGHDDAGGVYAYDTSPAGVVRQVPAR